MRSGDLHLVVYIRCTGIQRAAEYAGERKDVVDLVGIIAAARADNCGAGALCFIGEFSGVGFAQANTIASCAIVRTISEVKTPGADTPMNTSAPLITSARLPFSQA